MSSAESREADRASRNAAIMLALTLPADTVLYLLLPLYAGVFGLSLPEAGILLAANRAVRIVGYGWIARLYARRGPRTACLLATVAACVSILGYVPVMGFWAFLPLRLAWGLAFGAMNIANQALPTALSQGAARRTSRARAIVAVGPMIALVGSAVIAEIWGPRLVFLILGLVALPALWFAWRLPAEPEGGGLGARPRAGLPAPMDIWSFCTGLAADGFFVTGLALLAARELPQGAVVAAGAALSLRYLCEVVLTPLGGVLADRMGARRLLVILSLACSAGLALLGTGGVLLWLGVLVTVVLRAVIQSLPPLVIAEAFPGPDRVPALARQATWRDIGSGAGPFLAGILLPVVPALVLYGGGALMLAAASVAVAREKKR